MTAKPDHRASNKLASSSTLMIFLRVTLSSLPSHAWGAA
jgi:hypothetical protein